MKLQLAKYSDCGRIRELFRGLLTERDEKLFYSSFTSMQAGGEPKMLVAVLESDTGELIGAIAIRNDGYSGEICSIKVIPQYQGNGYGKFLVGMAAQFYNNCGFFNVTLKSTQSALYFWQHLQFKPKYSGEVVVFFTGVDCACDNLDPLTKVYRENKLNIVVDDDLQSIIKESDKTKNIYKKYQARDLLKKLITDTNKVLQCYEDNCVKTFLVSAAPQRLLLISEIKQVIASLESTLLKADLKQLKSNTQSLLAKLESCARQAEQNHRESGLRFFGMKLTSSRFACMLNELLTMHPVILDQTEDKMSFS